MLTGPIPIPCAIASKNISLSASLLTGNSSRGNSHEKFEVLLVIAFLLSLCALETGYHSCRLTNFRHKNRTVFPLLPPRFSVTSDRLKRYGGSVSESSPPFDPQRTDSPALKIGKVCCREFPSLRAKFGEPGD